MYVCVYVCVCVYIYIYIYTLLIALILLCISNLQTFFPLGEDVDEGAWKEFKLLLVFLVNFTVLTLCIYIYIYITYCIYDFMNFKSSNFFQWARTWTRTPGRKTNKHDNLMNMRLNGRLL